MTADHSYVDLRTTPYRGHWLLAEAVRRAVRPGGTVFEGGCSSGYFAEVMVDDGYVVDGAELDPIAAEQARAICRTVLTGDLSTMDLDGLADAYDGMVFGDTLEHLSDPVAVLARLTPRLADGGSVIISIPNVANWAMRVGFLFGRFRYTERGILDRTHLRFYTAKTVRHMLAEAGLEVTDLTASVPVPIVGWRPLLAAAHWIGNLRPSVFAYGFIITARASGTPAASTS
ncbi:MAG: Methyltransferase type 11 [Pseudonocardiales bacterium]|nr:Methyltransferase type 11 [Jatrophihabitantaceae bacterium]MCW2601899.1 Methyltransferase type 11 [Pseudonocardiales bacterium]